MTAELDKMKKVYVILNSLSILILILLQISWFKNNILLKTILHSGFIFLIICYSTLSIAKIKYYSETKECRKKRNNILILILLLILLIINIITLFCSFF